MAGPGRPGPARWPHRPGPGLGGTGEHGAGDLGQPGSDVVQGPGEHPDLAALPVHLDPDAVDLPLDRGRGHPLEGGRHGRRGGGQHRPQRPSHLKPEGPQRREGGSAPASAASAPSSAASAAMLRPGCPWSAPACPRAARAADRAASATAGSEPPSRRARRTSPAGTPAARATASTITPSSAPWCSSPASSRVRKDCSAGVARANRAPSSLRRSAWDPGPVVAPIAANTESVSARVRAGCAAGPSGPGPPSAGPPPAAGRRRRQSRSRPPSAAYPTPICRWRSSPDEERDRHRNLSRRRPAQQPGDLVDLDPAAGRQRYRV